MNGKHQIAELTEQLKPQIGEMRRNVAGAGRAVEKFIKDKPVQALAISLGIGVFLGWMIKR